MSFRYYTTMRGTFSSYRCTCSKEHSGQEGVSTRMRSCRHTRGHKILRSRHSHQPNRSRHRKPPNNHNFALGDWLAWNQSLSFPAPHRVLHTYLPPLYLCFVFMAEPCAECSETSLDLWSSCFSKSKTWVHPWKPDIWRKGFATCVQGNGAIWSADNPFFGPIMLVERSLLRGCQQCLPTVNMVGNWPWGHVCF